jgi:GTPase involved in cell partitioning and DNA repair
MIGVVIIAFSILYVYSTDQAKIRGFNFGNNLQAIQDELKHVQSDFYSKKRMLEENSITKEEFLEFSKDHVQRMDEIISKYDNMTIPDSFSNAVKLFKLSTQKQLESDQFLIEWVRTNDTANKVRSDLLLQESFEDEMAALASFNKAKNPSGQS